MIQGMDAATPQHGISWAAVRQAGIIETFIKLGGDNVGRYIAPDYLQEVEGALAVGEIVGGYWVPNAAFDPVGAADFYCANLHPRTAFGVLDNEPLDGAQLYSPVQAAAWITETKRQKPLPVYLYLGLAVARTADWTAAVNASDGVIIAAYSYAPLQLPDLTANGIPPGKIIGHQYTSSAQIGGVTVDLDAFVDGTLVTGTPGTRINNTGGDDMLTFMTDNPNGAWWATNGLTRSLQAPGQPQFLVDMGVAVWPDGVVGNVKIVSTAQLNLIPIAPTADSIAAAVVAKLPATVAGPSAADIAAAVRGVLHTNPLS